MWIKLYAITLPVFFAIDMLWLGVLAKNFYRGQIGGLMKADVNWFAAVLFYLIFIAGMVFFVIAPALEKGSWRYALFAGAAADAIADFEDGTDRIAVGYTVQAVLNGATQASVADAATLAQHLFDGRAGANDVAAIHVGTST